MLLALSASCTAATAHVAGWYITRQIDGYLDLDREQRARVRSAVDTTLTEARREHLPRWLELLRQTQGVAGQGASEARLDALMARYDALTDQAVHALAPRIASVLAELSDAQIDHFEARALAVLDETYPEQALPPNERRAALDARLLEQVTELVGDLRDEQRDTILAAAHALPLERPVQYRVGRERIRAGAAFLRRHPGASAIEDELHRLWRTRYQVLGPGRDKPLRRAEQRRFLLTVDATLSREQRAHAAEELGERIRQGERFVLAPEAEQAGL